MGSDPATHIRFMYNMYGLPSHLRVYSRAVARHIPGSRGSRTIDNRITPRSEAARNSTRGPGREPVTRRRTSTAREDKTPRAANPRVPRRRSGEDETPRPDNRAVAVEPTPAEATIEDPTETDVMEVVEVTEAPASEALNPVEPVFASSDLRFNKERLEEQDEKQRKRDKMKVLLFYCFTVICVSYY